MKHVAADLIGVMVVRIQCCEGFAEVLATKRAFSANCFVSTVFPSGLVVVGKEEKIGFFMTLSAQLTHS